MSEYSNSNFFGKLFLGLLLLMGMILPGSESLTECLEGKPLDVSIVSPIESDNVAVVLQDQFTPIIDIYMCRSNTTTNLNLSGKINDKSVK